MPEVDFRFSLRPGKGWLYWHKLVRRRRGFPRPLIPDAPATSLTAASSALEDFLSILSYGR